MQQVTQSIIRRDRHAPGPIVEAIARSGPLINQFFAGRPGFQASRHALGVDHLFVAISFVPYHAPLSAYIVQVPEGIDVAPLIFI
ncbi:MAG: hypothetical protein HRU76_06275 [Phycisphaeraceae bacterium]|nr:MAG: hypothetical protein HRU76_06275 [Phycisphaeraceae bacterium]